jgi:hypothetical protein
MFVAKAHGYDKHLSEVVLYSHQKKFLLLNRTLKVPGSYFRQAFANPEDASGVKGGKVMIGDPDVERVRRAHLNDIENIIPFVLLVSML